MRNFVAVALAVTLVSFNAVAATSGGPLPAGQPAGVKQAQDAEASNLLWYVVGFGVIAAGIGIIASGNGNGTLASGSVTTTTTATATATATKAATSST